jgi:hypothetical protein
MKTINIMYYLSLKAKTRDLEENLREDNYLTFLDDPNPGFPVFYRLFE